MKQAPMRRRRALAAAVREAEQARGLAENEQAIEDYNAFVERHGVFSDELTGCGRSGPAAARC